MQDIPAPRTGAMTREEINAVRREKEFDYKTRKQLEARYGVGSTRSGGNKRLTRAKAWRCSVCGQMSVDARHVCGSCLAVEPGVVGITPGNNSKNRQKSTSNRNDSLLRYTAKETGVSEDPMMGILSLAHGRSYRIATPAAAAAVVLRASSTKGKTPAERNTLIDTDEYDEEEEELLVPAPTTSTKEEEEERKAEVVVRNSEVRPRHTVPYTHFISLPIGKLPAVRPHAAALLEEMKRRCINTGTNTMVTEDIFTTAPRMHITLLLLSLTTEEAVKLAVERMQILQEKVREWKISTQQNKRPQVRLGGLHVMKGRGRNEKKAEVLYMGLADDESTAIVSSLQKIVHECFAELTMSDPSAVEDSKLLHMTLMNTKWRKDNSTNSNSKAKMKWQPRVPFDASYILQEFADASLHSDGDSRTAEGSGNGITLECVELSSIKYDPDRECYPSEYVVAL
ncbi:uncharacterized protein TM35_000251390 [Trypanosoma theileri]|uniref:A-kinase anchor protein 7-like phosphoesterase domain-containing protein n=1 Tax=Trypanosoma theileri TaxID=67003 RepID=A0A1X0NQT7_9TRYP|nr:uncharacterized protein TM35_000251390 [Trypanosoma theileri]ORC86843.1 hypothetical protein TM35_000251390 [Trypanosoma theileri]